MNSFKMYEPSPISILTPTYNRSKFLPLYIDNLQKFNYPKELLELFIYDDGDDKFIKDIEKFKKDIHPIKLKYFCDSKKQSIGYKRNYLIKNATNKIVCFMDDDDIYHPEYIRYSYNVLKNDKAGIVGSPQMLFVFPDDDYLMTFIRCEHKHQIHEATMMMTKKYFRSMGGGFQNTSRGEGAKMIQTQDKNVSCTDINLIMICVAHDGNSVDKNCFKEERHQLNQKYTGDKLDILKSILMK